LYIKFIYTTSYSYKIGKATPKYAIRYFKFKLNSYANCTRLSNVFDKFTNKLTETNIQHNQALHHQYDYFMSYLLQ